jgi:hypothetical protein
MRWKHASNALILHRVVISRQPNIPTNINEDPLDAKMSTTAQLFVLACLRGKVTEWASGQWATPAETRVRITQELQADDALCLQIFESLMSVCAPGHEKDVFDQLRGVLNHIHILLVQGATSTSDAWRQCYAQTTLWRRTAGPQQLQVLAEMRARLSNV